MSKERMEEENDVKSIVRKWSKGSWSGDLVAALRDCACRSFASPASWNNCAQYTG